MRSVTEPLDLDLLATAPGSPDQPAAKSDRQMLTTLFALGREVSSVLDLDELFRKLPDLISRVTDYHAFAIYLLDEERGDLHIGLSLFLGLANRSLLCTFADFHKPGWKGPESCFGLDRPAA